MQQHVSSPHWVERRHPRSGDLCPLYPRKRTLQRAIGMSALCQKRTYAPLDATYSITTFADASRPGGTLIPIALAVDRLMTSSNWVGCTTGMSAGFSPLRIRPV